MFVRWHHYQRQDGSTYWNAALVAAVVRGKRPRQQHIVALGGIAETDARKNVAACQEFWTKALQRLAVRNLSKADRQKIEAALAARVKRPAEEQLRHLRDLDRSLHQAERVVEKIKAEMKGGRSGSAR